MSKEEIIAQQAKQIAELQASLQAAMREIAELKALLAQNSRNSSRPPSSDGLRKAPAPAPAFPRSPGKARGGQKGHQGDTLKMVAQADQVVLHPVADRCSCGGDLSQVEGQVSAKRQVFDLPAQALVITEHHK